MNIPFLLFFSKINLGIITFYFYGGRSAIVSRPVDYMSPYSAWILRGCERVLKATSAKY